MTKLWICVCFLVVVISHSDAAPSPSLQNDIVNVVSDVVSAALQPSAKKTSDSTTQQSLGLLDPALLKPILDIVSKNPKYLTALISDPEALAKAMNVVTKPNDPTNMVNFMMYMMSKHGTPNFRK